MENIIIIPAGDDSYHDKCNWNATNSKKEYDLCINYFGDNNEISTKYKNNSEYFYTFKGPKWQIIRQVLEKIDVEKYKFIWIPDDDLQMSVRDINNMFGIAKKYNLNLSQPSLYDQYSSRKILLNCKECIIHYTNFIEIQAPLFNKETFNKIKHTLMDPDIKSAWGLDYIWEHMIKERLAVIDYVIMKHMRPMSMNVESSFYKKYNINPRLEYYKNIEKYNVKVKKNQERVLKKVFISKIDYKINKIIREYYEDLFKLNISEISDINLFKQIDIDFKIYKNNNRDKNNKYVHKMKYLFNKYNKVRSHDAEIAGVHIKINNNKLEVIELNKSHETRNDSVIKLLEKTLEIYRLPNIECFFITNDYINLKKETGVDDYPFFVMSKKEKSNNIMYPDFTFNEWLEAQTENIEKEKQKINNNSNKIPFEERENKLFFRGAKTHYIREFIYNKVQDNKNNDKNKFDIIVSKNFDKTNFVYLKDHVKWKYLVHIPGISYSSRLKYLFFTKSLVFNIKKKSEYEWIEFWYHIIKSNKHYIRINDENNYNNKGKIESTNGMYNDTNNEKVYNQLTKYINYYNDNEDKAKQIALDSFNIVFNILTIKNIYRYYAILLLKYSKYF
jgi:hypothetical protein